MGRHPTSGLRRPIVASGHRKTFRIGSDRRLTTRGALE
jgi:hypothetical protein